MASNAGPEQVIARVAELLETAGIPYMLWVQALGLERQLDVARAKADR